MQSQSVRWRRFGALLLAAGLLAPLAGCEIWSAMSVGLKGTDPAVQELADRRTLVLVDDPKLLLTDAGNRVLIASKIGQDLAEAEAILDFVPPAQYNRFASEQGDAFDRMPTDEVGRALDARQVIVVLLDDLQMRRGPGAFRPTLSMWVKVIDTETGERVFPDPDKVADPAATIDPRGYPVEAALYYAAAPEDLRTGSALMMQELSLRAGREVARLFHAHVPRQPGEMFEQ